MTNIHKYRDITLEFPLGRVGVSGHIKLTKGITIGGVMDLSTGQMIPGTGQDVVTGEVPFFKNIITNYGLDALAANIFNDVTVYCHAGTGTTAEAAGNTALVTFLASTLTIQSSAESAQSSAPYYGKYTKTYRFGAGVAAGNVSEIGFSNQATTGNLFSRSLVKDGGGSPTTITVLGTEWLDVTYEFRLYPDHILADGSADDGTGSITISGTSYSYTIRPANVTNYLYYRAAQAEAVYVSVSGSYGSAYGSDGALGAATSTPTGSSQDAPANPDTTISAASYSNGTYARNISMVMGLNDANVTGGCKVLMFHTGMGAYQIRFGTVVPKTNTKVWTFVTNLAWTRATI